MAMQQFLAEFYGTAGASAPAQDDFEKEASVQLFVKLAKEENIDLSTLSDAQVEELYGTFREKMAEGEDAPAEGAEGEGEGEEEAEEDAEDEAPAEDEAEAEAEEDEDEAEEEADAAGEDEAAPPAADEKAAAFRAHYEAGKKALRGAIGRAGGAAKARGQRMAQGAKSHGQRALSGAKAQGQRAYEGAKKHPKKTLGGAAGAAALGGAGGYALHRSGKKEASPRAVREYEEKRAAAAKLSEADFLGRQMAHAYVDELRKIAADDEKKAPPFEKKKKEKETENEDEAAPEKKASDASFDQLAVERAYEMVHAFNKTAEAGYDLAVAAQRLSAVYTLGLPETTKTASAATFTQARDVRALEYLEAAGYPVTWAG